MVCRVDGSAQKKSLPPHTRTHTAMLFKDGQILHEKATEFDEDGEGYMSHEEFGDILDQLNLGSVEEPYKLSNEQKRNVFHALDADDDVINN